MLGRSRLLNCWPRISLSSSAGQERDRIRGGGSAFRRCFYKASTYGGIVRWQSRPLSTPSTKSKSHEPSAFITTTVHIHLVVTYRSMIGAMGLPVMGFAMIVTG